MIATTLRTLFRGTYVGTDSYGNRYYKERFWFYRPKSRTSRRWVVYNGVKEASKVPAYWHRWLHYMTDEVPMLVEEKQYAWQKGHHPNLSGTTKAYYPGQSSFPVQKKMKPYDAWDPKES